MITMKSGMKHIPFILYFLFSGPGLFAYTVIEDAATKAGVYDIPIKVCLPEKSTGKMPVMFFVHGGGWNGGDEKEVPPASIPADCDYLCDRMGIIYVGLAYRCKGNNGTFHLALQDLEASIKWFGERADQFNADMSRIGFSGGSAGTTLSAVLAQRYPDCVVYVGREGMYNVLDLDTNLSNFPSAQSRADFGLITREQKLEASPYHLLRKDPAASLLLHGKDDWLCHYSQSVKYAEKIEKAGGKCELVLYDGINHTCLNRSYPEVFRNSMMEIARLLAEGYELEDVDFTAIRNSLDLTTELLFPYEKIPAGKLTGNWKNNRYGTFTFRGNGEGHFVNRSGQQTRSITYENKGSWFSVRVEGEEMERTFYLRKNDQAIYELVTEDNRYKSRRNDYRKL
jgi:acetyl esterase/lipase